MMDPAMRFLKRLPDPDRVVEDYSLSLDQNVSRMKRIAEIKDILDGSSTRKLLIVGPCSADREDAVLTYMENLAGLARKVCEKLLVVPRIYTSKPRTNGIGYKGLVHRPNALDGRDSIYDGIIAMRKMHLHVIQHTGLFGVDEMLYPDMLDYIRDLLVYVAIGARSVENQEHRLVASGLEMPVGMKNPTSGDVNILMNAITCAQNPQSLAYRGWEVATSGNPFAHAIIRGFNDRFGGMHPNYHCEDMRDLYDIYLKSNLKNMSVIVDCSHANSRKRYSEQGRIAKETISLCRGHPSLMRFVKGVMIESYLEDGSQMVGAGGYGRSITDPCLGWEKTERLVMELCEAL